MGLWVSNAYLQLLTGPRMTAAPAQGCTGRGPSEPCLGFQGVPGCLGHTVPPTLIFSSIGMRRLLLVPEYCSHPVLSTTNMPGRCSHQDETKPHEGSSKISDVRNKPQPQAQLGRQ